jgi:hypothetical protein
MSITNDIRSYADTALEQGKQVVGQAQAQLNGLTGTARTNVTQLTSRATGAVTDLRTQAEKTLNLDAIRTAVEPYLAQAKQYRASVTDRAEGLIETVKSDKRVAKVVATAESFTRPVVGTVTERVVKPVSALTGRGTKPAGTSTTTSPAKKATTKATTKATAKKASKPASTRPAAKKATAAKKSPAKKAATTKATS